MFLIATSNNNLLMWPHVAPTWLDLFIFNSIKQTIQPATSSTNLKILLDKLRFCGYKLDMHYCSKTPWMIVLYLLLNSWFELVCGFFFFFSTQVQVETRILGLVLIVLRDWAWFTAAKLGWFRTRWCTEHKSYNTYMLIYKKYMHWTAKNNKGTQW